MVSLLLDTGLIAPVPFFPYFFTPFHSVSLTDPSPVLLVLEERASRKACITKWLFVFDVPLRGQTRIEEGRASR